MDAELICVGDELLRGEIADTHTQHVARRLDSAGVRLRRVTVVSDDEADIRAAVSAALERADTVLVTGGLGPTVDDRTREAVAHLLGRRIVEDADVLDAIRRRFAQRGLEMAPAVRRQAGVPEGFRVMPNRLGTAPGLAGGAEGKHVYLLPGPPHEMQGILDESVLPEITLDERGSEGTVSFLTSGLGESQVQEQLGGLAQDPRVRLSYRARPGEVRVRVDARAPEDAHAVLSEAKSRLGVYFVGVGDGDPARATGEALRAAALTLATAESCTGGLLGGRLTSVPGSSRWYLGGVVSYSDAAKCDLLGVPADVLEAKGAVSADVARAMAEGVRERLHSALGVGVTGVAGPSGGTREKPVGLTYVAVASQDGAKTVRKLFGGDRERNRLWAVAVALNLVRWTALGAQIPDGEGRCG